MSDHPPRDTSDVHVRNVPDYLWKQVKAKAAVQGQTVQQFVIAALTLAVGRETGQ